MTSFVSGHALTSSPADEIRLSLRALGRRLLRYDLVGKVDLSGVIQQTFLDAHMAGPRFPAAHPAQGSSWLRRVFRRNLTDSIRQATAARRDVSREVALDGTIGLASGFLSSDVSSPSGQASQAEVADRLAQALATLPTDQARAVELRFLQGLAVEEISAALGRSRQAVAGLLKRGLRNLRTELRDPGSWAA